MKPGVKTTEFWTTLATFAFGAVALVHPGFKAPPGAASTAATVGPAVVAAVYALGRSAVKSAASRAAVASTTVVNNAAAAPPAIITGPDAVSIAREIIKALSPKATS